MICRHQKFRSHFLKGIDKVANVLLYKIHNCTEGGDPELRYEEIINMYTTEAIKSTK